MSRQRIIWLILPCFVVLLIGAFLLFSKNTEPSYKGRSLSKWHDLKTESRQGYEPAEVGDEAELAIRAIGTNAIPYLLQCINQPNPRPLSFLEMQIYEVPLLGRWLYGMRSSSIARAEKAVDMFHLLGPLAAPALPALTNLVNTSKDGDVTSRALWVLIEMGDHSLPFLLSIIGDTNHQRRAQAVHFIWYMSPRNLTTNFVLLTPSLVRCATNHDSKLALSAINALGRIRFDPEAAIPVLTNALNSTNESVRWSALRSLSLYGEQASNAIPAVHLVMQNDDQYSRVFGTNVLQQIQKNVP